jgi:hypothetical protein
VEVAAVVKESIEENITIDKGKSIRSLDLVLEITDIKVETTEGGMIEKTTKIGEEIDQRRIEEESIQKRGIKRKAKIIIRILGKNQRKVKLKNLK